MSVARTRLLIALLTLAALLLIAAGVTGFELPRLGAGSAAGTQPRAALAGIRQVGSDLVVRVGADSPAGGELGFMTVDASGNLLATDTRRHTVMRFDPTGHMLSEWGPTFGDATLTEPAGIASFQDSYYVLDRGTPRIFRLDAAGRLTGTISLESLGTYGLNGMAVDPTGNLFVADTGRNRILVFSPAGQLVKQIGRNGKDLGGFTQPMMLAFAPDGSFYVADWENTRIERFDANFEATDVFPTGSSPWGVAVDQAGRVFVPDADHHRVAAYTPTGTSLGELGGQGGDPISIVPRQLAFARSDRPSIYVLGGDGIVRVDFENTAPPPQGGSDVDFTSLLVIGLLVAFIAFAIVSRRGRRAASVGAALDGKVGLHSKNGAGAEDQQAKSNQHRRVLHQAERKNQPADEDDQAKDNAQTHQT